MQGIKHQLQSREFYIPNWEIEHLFIGTFNPEGGEKVNYYYGRKKNQTWKLISRVFNDDFNPDASNFFNLLEKHKIGCVDMIDEIVAADDKIERIIGKGYKDNEIINTSVKRLYNTQKIIDIVQKNKNVKLYSTWGNGSKLKEWIKETKRVENIIPLVSPSLAARVPKGAAKFDYMLNDWSKKIKL